MLEAICRMLRGFGIADEGVECVLNDEAFFGFLGLIRTAYGDHACEVVRKFWTKREDDNGNDIWVCIEDAEEAFRLCLTGKG